MISNRKMRALSEGVVIYYSVIDLIKIVINKTNEYDVIRFKLYFKWVENDRLKGIIVLETKIVPSREVKLRVHTLKYIGDKWPHEDDSQLTEKTYAELEIKVLLVKS